MKRHSVVLRDLLEEYRRYVGKTKEKLATLPRSSNIWWRSSSTLMMKTGRASSIRSLKTAGGTWLLKPEEKAEHFAETFRGKYVLPTETSNTFSHLESLDNELDSFFAVRTRKASKVLTVLDVESGIGRDSLSSRELKNCCVSLAVLVAMLARRVLHSGCWPRAWKAHWTCPI
jgi:hypothetical protein